MIQNCSKLRVYDNSGANVVKCFKTFKFKNNAKLNKIIKISVQELKIHKKTIIKKGQVFNALIIKSKYTKPRFNGQRISFDNNGCILINNINFKNKLTPFCTCKVSFIILLIIVDSPTWSNSLKEYV